MSGIKYNVTMTYLLLNYRELKYFGINYYFLVGYFGYY